MAPESAALPQTPTAAPPEYPAQPVAGGVPVAPEAFACSLLPGGGGALAARLVDLSPDGIRLALKRPVSPGAVLGIEWHSRSERTPCFLLAIIQRSVAQAGGWVVSGRFAHKLNADEWRTLQ